MPDKHSTRPFDIVMPGQADEAAAVAARARFGFAGVDRLEDDASDLARSAPRYALARELATAMNMALCVRAPLLVTGEPGTGKTQAAYFLRWLLRIPLFRFQVRSTSTADELRWDFDAVSYLHYAQSGVEPKKLRDDPEFLKPRALWRAFDCTTPSILLIDEIDKAPRDFPNDLLRELDERRFTHPFDDKREIAPRIDGSPIVIATSNAERRLPDAFLRRCIVHHIELTPDLVAAITGAHSGSFPRLDDATRTRAIERFLDLRKVDGLSRRPSTAELLAWLAVLSARGTPRSELDKPLSDLPGLGAIVKDHEDLTVLASRRAIES